MFTTVANMEDKYQTATATVIYGVMRVDLQTYAKYFAHILRLLWEYLVL